MLLHTLTGGRWPGLALRHKPGVPAASTAPTTLRSQHREMLRSSLRRHRSSVLPDPPGPARQAQHHISDHGGTRLRRSQEQWREEPDSPVPTAPAIIQPSPRVPPALGPCPAPSCSRQPLRGFLPSTGTFSCPKPGQPGGRGVSGQLQPPGFPCMGSISCTKTETKPNASDSLPFFV